MVCVETRTLTIALGLALLPVLVGCEAQPEHTHTAVMVAERGFEVR